MQKIVAVPELRTLFGLISSHMRCEGTTSLRFTVPTKPFNEPMLTLELADDPRFEGAGDEAVTEKSMKLKVVLVECDRDAVLPVMVKA